MKLSGMVLVGLTNAETDFQVVSCNNESTKAPEMTIKVRDLLTVIDHTCCKGRPIDPWSKLKSRILL